ncbi:polymer-forming cytoskeletal protein [Acetobacteraceae bacterium]|nr:polymer-forming cytoskeletal protein [Acetobacteraceae bacterium]
MFKKTPSFEGSSSLSDSDSRPATAETPSAPTVPSVPRRVIGNRPFAFQSVEAHTLVVGEGIHIRGEISNAQRLIIQGSVKTERIVCTDFVIEEKGSFEGTVETENADIAGIMDGEIVIKDNLTVQSTGKLLGKTLYRKLRVEHGGRIVGDIEVLADDQA